MKIRIRKYKSKDSESLEELNDQFVKFNSKFDDSFLKVIGYENILKNYIESNISNDLFNCTVAEIDVIEDLYIQ